VSALGARRRERRGSRPLPSPSLTVAAVLVAARMYRIGVLLYGQKPSLKAVFSRDLAQTAR